jgi:alpha-tubulin suppressor-like RCC1 family protein
LNSITQISAGGAHSLVLTTSGQVYSFGENFVRYPSFLKG